jgi:cysteine sulfinate desulfinase/cysteine desulfurase-like protein
MQRIYLDYNASTPVDPAVAAAMTPFLSESYGNPSSGHWAAAPAKAAIEAARSKVAVLLGCHEDEVIFTSGGTEANNLALKGVYFARRDRGDHIITTRVEHPAILEPCRFLERLGARITYLPVDGFGRVDPDDLNRAITPRTILISIMHANNEGIALNGHPANRLPNTLNVSFIGCVGAEILDQLDGVAASTGSACHAGRIELSPVLEAMGVAPEMGMGAIRFSLGRGTTNEEIASVAERLSAVI